MPARLKPAVQARTSYGDIDSDFPVISKANFQPSPGEPGAPRVNLRNQNGNIRVRSE